MFWLLVLYFSANAADQTPEQSSRWVDTSDWVISEQLRGLLSAVSSASRRPVMSGRTVHLVPVLFKEEKPLLSPHITSLRGGSAVCQDVPHKCVTLHSQHHAGPGLSVCVCTGRGQTSII